MMKRHIIKLLILALLPLFSACTEWLDLRPTGEVVLEDFWQNETEVTQVVMACYRSLSEADNIERMIVWGEVRSDNLVKTGNTNSDILKILDVDINAANGYARWGSMYRTINYCNTFLHFAPDVMNIDENFTPGRYSALEAEVLTIRALSYFYLVRTFGNVPLVLDPSIDDTQDYNVPQATEREILDQIIADLETAKANARTSYTNTEHPKARITQAAVRALLADIYLWDEQYEACIEECEFILQDSRFELEPTNNMFRGLFYDGNSKESIFELAYDDDVMSNTAVRDFYGWDQSKYGQLSLPVFLADGNKSPFAFRVGTAIEGEEDIRFKDNVNLRQSISGYYFVFKYAGIERVEFESSNAYYYSNFSPNWILYRLPDAMLMKAEALVQLNRSENDLKNALKLVNHTYLRANAEDEVDSLRFENYADVSKLEELVLREKHREFMFEGKRWYDLMRIARRDGTPDRLLNYVSPKFTGNQSLQYSKMSVMDALYLPIHQDELDANPELEQNPFYEITGGSVRN